MQSQIYHTTQDTNRGVLQIHHEMVDLQQLVKATLVINLRGQHLQQQRQQGLEMPKFPFSSSDDHIPSSGRDRDVLGFQLLAKLARFKAFEKPLEHSVSDSSNSEEVVVGAHGATLSPSEKDEFLNLGKASVEKEEVRIKKCQIRILHRHHHPHGRGIKNDQSKAEEEEDVFEEMDDQMMSNRSEAIYTRADGEKQHVWIEWKE